MPLIPLLGLGFLAAYAWFNPPAGTASDGSSSPSIGDTISSGFSELATASIATVAIYAGLKIAKVI